MAVYSPATVWEKAVDICRIPRSEDKDGFTIYVIEIRVIPYKWQVTRRYKQFVELHEKLIKQFSVKKSLLPPKKVFGNRSESFINERQKALELYLQTLIYQFSLLPEPLAVFLDFQKYEVRVITATLSEKLFSEGEDIISNEKTFEFTPLELHAITERLKLGDPTCYSNNPQQDIAHLVEFITQLKHLKIVGSSEYFEASNIIQNDLSYDLSMFKSVETLEIYNCKLKNNLISVDALRPRLKSLIVHKSLTDLSNLLLCEILHWFPVTDPVQNWPFWHCITYADLSRNSLGKIHPSIKLLSSVKHIDLSHNEIQVIENMETLSELSVLILSHNKIKDLESLHTRLGNIQSLTLTSNKIKSLHGLSKLFSISELYLENNLIVSMSELAHLKRLPCLEILNLQNNPVTFTVDYRSQLLLMFEFRAPEILFDGVKATEKEIDTVSVLQALKQARGEPTSALKHNGPLEGTSAELASCNTAILSRTSHERNNIEKKSAKVTSNFHDVSKFRQQVETLRKIGGSDWLRLLNEMHSHKATSGVDSENHGNSSNSSNDFQCHSVCSLDKKQLSSKLIKTYTISYEISYPEWLLFLDSSNTDFKQQLLKTYIQHDSSANTGDTSSTPCTPIDNAKVLWAVTLKQDEAAVRETPVCILILPTEIVFLKLKDFTANESTTEMIHVPKLYPVFLYERSIASLNILSVCLGPCDAYIELKVKVENKSETITILMLNKSVTDIFINECHRLYETNMVLKSNPFVNKIFELEIPHNDVSLTNNFITKQVIFNQRVCVSRAFHKCQLGVLHYVFVTPSHIILVEEKLHCPEVAGIDPNLQPQFQICVLVSVHSNIKQVHLKDIDYETDYELNNDICSPEVSRLKCDAFLENEKFDILYKCGSWLIMEFESNVLLYLNFFNLKFRNEFLNAFLCARSQK